MDVESLSRINSTLGAGVKKKKESGKSTADKTGKTKFGKIIEKKSVEINNENITALRDFIPLDGSESLEELLDDVHSKGDELKRDPVLGPLKEYKNAVRRFLKYILDNSIEAEEVMGVRNPKTLKQKKYLLVKVVDEKLEKLAVHVLRGQSEQLDILKRIEEIQGLLVDIIG